MNFIFTILLILGIILIAAIVFFSRYSLSKVDGRSMEPTYFGGDIAIVDRHHKTFERNKVYVLMSKYDEYSIIKRVIHINEMHGEQFLWIEGDNKENSKDSREYGYIAASNVIGEVVYVWKRKRKQLSSKLS